MTLDEGFIQAIRDDPNDNTPRRVYADYLEERGNPLGEFIRLELELWQTGPSWGERYRRLKQRRDALLDENWARWTGPLDDLGIYYEDHERGFVHQICTTVANFVEHAAAIFQVAPCITRAILEGHGRQVVELAGCPHLSRLRKLHLRDRRKRIGVQGVRALAASPYISELRELILSGMSSPDASAAALAASPHLSGLSVLDLSGNEIGDAGAGALAGSPALARLIRLDLSSNRIGDAGLTALARTPALAALRRLDLDSNLIGLDGVQALAASPHVAGLEYLTLGGNEGIGDAGATALADSSHLRGLRSLFLRGNRIGDVGARALAESPYLNRLCVLDLQRDFSAETTNNVGPEAGQALRARFGPMVWFE